MTNLEFYRDKIIEMLSTRTNSLACAFKEIRTNNGCEGKTCNKCGIESLMWLLEEHKEPIKLKQWEYDLLFIYSYDSTAKFEDSSVLSKMKENGHFKSITDTSMALEEIVNNCEVVE